MINEMILELEILCDARQNRENSKSEVIDQALKDNIFKYKFILYFYFFKQHANEAHILVLKFIRTGRDTPFGFWWR